MVSLIRTPVNRNPGRRTDPLHLWESFFSSPQWLEEAASADITPPIDITERDDEYIIKADMPGIKKQDIDINLENGVLTISAETKSEAEEKSGERVIRSERRYGNYVRSLRLGTQINEANVKATLQDGVLELVLPKAESVKPKKIAVNVN